MCQAVHLDTKGDADCSNRDTLVPKIDTCSRAFRCCSLENEEEMFEEGREDYDFRSNAREVRSKEIFTYSLGIIFLPVCMWSLNLENGLPANNDGGFGS